MADRDVVARENNLAFPFLTAQNGERDAIVTDERTWTYAEVEALAAFYGARVAEIEPESRVALIAPDGVDFVAALFAIIALGGVAVMINPELNPAHMSAILKQAQAPIALVHRTYLDLVAGNIPDSTAVLELTTTETPPPAASLSVVAVSERSPALWLFSGGTTGVPKIVVQSHGSFLNTTRRYARETLGYRPQDRTIAVPRLFFGYATGSALFFPFSVGASTVLFETAPTPEVLIDQIDRHNPTILVTTPSAVGAMLQNGAIRSLGSLRFATSAGEALPETLYHRWKDRFGIELLDGLGTAEMWHIFVTNTLEAVRPGTVGKPVPGFEIRARDETGTDLLPDEVGLLWVRGDSAALGYFNQPELTEEVFRGEWVVTGDLISIDTDGFITHRGRADDALKVKGKWLRPQEVESCLLDHPEVREVAVVGVSDADGLAKPVAFVVRSGEVEEAELKEHVLKRLEPYKHPRRVVFVDALPLTHLGKVDRGALKRLAEE